MKSIEIVAKTLDDTGHFGRWNLDISWHVSPSPLQTHHRAIEDTRSRSETFNSHSPSPIAVQLPRTNSAFRAAPGSQAAALKISGTPRGAEGAACFDAVTVCRTSLANPVIYTCKRCGDSIRQGRRHRSPKQQWHRRNPDGTDDVSPARREGSADSRSGRAIAVDSSRMASPTASISAHR